MRHMDTQTMENLTAFVPIVVALIAVVGTLYTSIHTKPFENIKTLSETLKTLTEVKEKFAQGDSSKGLGNVQKPLDDAIKALTERLELESDSIRPYPEFLGLGFSGGGLILLAVSSFISDAHKGIIIMTFAVILMCVGFWLIPRCGKRQGKK